MAVAQSGPADSYGERSLERAWNFSDFVARVHFVTNQNAILKGLDRKLGQGLLKDCQCRSWVKSGQTIAGQNPPLSAVPPKADIRRLLQIGFWLRVYEPMP
jgi:hypothetical protein